MASPRSAADCVQPACESSQESFSKAMAFALKTASSKSPTSSSSSSSSPSKPSPSTILPSPTPSSTSPSQPIPPVEPEINVGCPLNREVLGHFSWSLLHTISAYYPSTPSPTQKTSAINLITSLADLYPCMHCAADFQESIKVSPPDERVGTRVDFCKYLCELHNEVNVKIGKEVVKCDIGSLDVRWRTGVVECRKGKEESSEESLGHR